MNAYAETAAWALPFTDGSADRNAAMHIAVERADTPSQPTTRALFAYHAERQAAGGIIRRADIPNRALIRAMPGLYIIAPAGPPENPVADWRFRLAGTELVARLGHDPTGVRISRILSPAQTRHQAGIYAEIAAGRLATVTRGRLKGLGRDFIHLEMAQVPMLAADGTTGCVLGVMAFLDEAPCGA